ncbi:MAG TPA: hypothetical protein VFG14_03120 [Chthoniobacteraceae bacterium]|nr:hypothetical protein [Chthoniobacteraceae bacterium]
MRKLISLASIALSFFTTASANDSFTLDSQGYIRHWLMLAPIPLPDEEPGSEAIYKQQVRGEAALRPRAGDTVKVGVNELRWQNIIATTNFFDFNAVLKTVNDRAAGYMVTYVECERDRPDVIMAVASNDEGRIYFNGADIYLFNEPRPLMLDADKGKVTLKKGINVIIFKVINEQNAWQGAIRLLEKEGTPLKDIKVKLSP